MMNTCFKKFNLDNMRRYKWLEIISATIIMAITQNSCNTYRESNISYNYNMSDSINYGLVENWAAHPMKKDNADSISAVYEEEINLDICDVFFLHPTSFTEKEWRHVENASVYDDRVNKKTDNTSILYQSTIFNEIGRIYAPRYRQAHIERYYDSGVSQMRAFNLAYGDVKNAFETYLEQWNNGRKIVIAAHSQGTTHAIRLIKEMVDNSSLQNKVVMIYLLGMPVKKREFQTIRACDDDSTNYCFQSWRTYKKGYVGPYTDLRDTTIQVTNPVDIYAKKDWAGLKKKKTAILWKYNSGYEKTHDSKIMGNMLWITRPKFRGGLVGIFIKNYHAGDFNLFYGDVKLDIKRRLLLGD